MDIYEELANLAKDYSRAISMTGRWREKATAIEESMRVLSEKLVQERFPTEAALVVNESEAATEQESV